MLVLPVPSALIKSPPWIMKWGMTLRGGGSRVRLLEEDGRGEERGAPVKDGVLIPDRERVLPVFARAELAKVLCRPVPCSLAISPRALKSKRERGGTTHFGTMSSKSSILIRPAGVCPMAMSKKTIGRGMAGWDGMGWAEGEGRRGRRGGGGGSLGESGARRGCEGSCGSVQRYLSTSCHSSAARPGAVVCKVLERALEVMRTQ